MSCKVHCWDKVSLRIVKHTYLPQRETRSKKTSVLNDSMSFWIIYESTPNEVSSWADIFLNKEQKHSIPLAYKSQFIDQRTNQIFLSIFSNPLSWYFLVERKNTKNIFPRRYTNIWLLVYSYYQVHNATTANDDDDDFPPSKFFTPVLIGNFSLKSEWQQVSSDLQGSSTYTSWSQQCCGFRWSLFFR